jgi:trk system potassium uptake protein
MKIMVIGCGRVGAELAIRLVDRGHRVTVIDRERSAFEILTADFRGHTVQGDVLAQGVLRRAGIEQVDGLAAVTNSDAVNAVVARTARTVYGVPNVVVRNYDPRWHPMHEVFGHPVVSSATWDAQRLDQLLCRGEVHAVFTAGAGEVAVYEVPVVDRWSSRSAREALGTGDWRLVGLTRDGRAMLAGDDLTIQRGDVLVVAATPDGIAALRAHVAR